MSRFGMCVDIDECSLGVHNCDPKTETCFNLEGSFTCGCKWSFRKENGACVSDSSLKEVEKYVSIRVYMNM